MYSIKIKRNFFHRNLYINWKLIFHCIFNLCHLLRKRFPPRSQIFIQSHNATSACRETQLFLSFATSLIVIMRKIRRWRRTHFSHLVEIDNAVPPHKRIMTQSQACDCKASNANNFENCEFSLLTCYTKKNFILHITTHTLSYSYSYCSVDLL